MARLLRILLTVAYLAAAGLPCAVPDESAVAPERMRAYASAALHAHGDAPESADGELHAPCTCGCDETPAGRLVATPLGAALVPASAALDLPRAAHLPTPLRRAQQILGQPSDPVPRLA